MEFEDVINHILEINLLFMEPKSLLKKSNFLSFLVFVNEHTVQRVVEIKDKIITIN